MWAILWATETVTRYTAQENSWVTTKQSGLVIVPVWHNSLDHRRWHRTPPRWGRPDRQPHRSSSGRQTAHAGSQTHWWVTSHPHTPIRRRTRETIKSYVCVFKTNYNWFHILQILLFDFVARCVLTYHRQIWVQGLREAVCRVVMGCPDLNVTSLRLQSDGSIDHETLGSTNAKVWMEEHHTHHPAHKDERSNWISNIIS